MHLLYEIFNKNIITIMKAARVAHHTNIAFTHSVKVEGEWLRFVPIVSDHWFFCVECELCHINIPWKRTCWGMTRFVRWAWRVGLRKGRRWKGGVCGWWLVGHWSIWVSTTPAKCTTFSSSSDPRNRFSSKFMNNARCVHGYYQSCVTCVINGEKGDCCQLFRTIFRS